MTIAHFHSFLPPGFSGGWSAFLTFSAAIRKYSVFSKPEFASEKSLQAYENKQI
jgi:hypothetical protein